MIENFRVVFYGFYSTFIFCLLFHPPLSLYFTSLLSLVFLLSSPSFIHSCLSLFPFSLRFHCLKLASSLIVTHNTVSLFLFHYFFEGKAFAMVPFTEPLWSTFLLCWEVFSLPITMASLDIIGRSLNFLFNFIKFIYSLSSAKFISSYEIINVG